MGKHDKKMKKEGDKQQKKLEENLDNNSNEVEEKETKGTYDIRNKLNDLTSSEWVRETVSVFTQKGLGSNHEDTKIEKQHPAPFSFQDIARLINFFTKKGEKVLDPFDGVASTLKACALNDREGYGIELNEVFHKLSKERLKKEIQNTLIERKQQHPIQGNSLEEVKKFGKEFFDFIITSPPYWNILNTIDNKVKANRIANGLITKYGDNPKDLSNIEKYEDFISTLGDFFDSCSEILKPKKYMVIIVSDFRKKERYYSFHSDLANYIVNKHNFTLKGITILYQRHKKIMPYGYPFSYVPNIHHQYILIFQKNGEK
jgi:DNA modification methylase